MSVNKAIIVGRLGSDPELRYTNSGTAVCRFSVATGKKYVNNSGQEVNDTQWHRIVAWAKNAENANTYLKKGSEIYIEGEIKTSKYEKEGQTHYATDIHVGYMQFIGGKAANSNSDNSEQPPQQNNQNQNKPKQQNQNRQANQSNQNNQNNQNEGPEPDFSDFGGKPGDDDIPF